ASELVGRASGARPARSGRRERANAREAGTPPSSERANVVGTLRRSDERESGSAMKLGPVGIWSTHFRYRDADEARDAAALVDELGYAALWIPGGVGGDVFSTVDRALAATSKLVVATGILNIWMHDPAE